jgi:hypothetical protein
MAAKKAARGARAATASADEVEVVGKPGLSLDEGIVLTTFFLLIVAIVLVYFANQHYVIR